MTTSHYSLIAFLVECFVHFISAYIIFNLVIFWQVEYCFWFLFKIFIPLISLLIQFVFTWNPFISSVHYHNYWKSCFLVIRLLICDRQNKTIVTLRRKLLSVCFICLSEHFRLSCTSDKAKLYKYHVSYCVWNIRVYSCIFPRCLYLVTE